MKQEKLWACTVWASHLFLDGRFTRGAASIWPVESDGGKKERNILVCCLEFRLDQADGDSIRTLVSFLLLTLVAGDHVTDLLEDVCEASGARDLGVFLGCGQPPRAHRPRRLKGRELRQEHVWKQDTHGTRAHQNDFF